MKKENKGKNGKGKNSGFKKNHLFLIAIVILLIGLVGAGVIGHIISKNSAGNDKLSSSNINMTVNNEDVPKEGYALITIYGLNCYVKTEYTNFIHVTDDTYYDGLEGYEELTKGKSVDFVDYSDFAQFFTRDGKFRIEVSKSLEPRGLMNYNDKTDTSKNITVKGNKVSIITIKKFSSQSVTDKEFTFAFFKVKDKYVELGWAGNTVDMYVIESFFELN
ncbi:MAG: hypothetical protein FWH54_03765 [Methanobrevibacter sp.]|nr:hypothetical protein [Methanobrevibacter sp.]